jgi:hypothetical protein
MTTKRHGTTTLFAALEIATGKVTDVCYPRHRQQEFHIRTAVLGASDQLGRIPPLPPRLPDLTGGL